MGTGEVDEMIGGGVYLHHAEDTPPLTQQDAALVCQSYRRTQQVTHRPAVEIVMPSLMPVVITWMNYRERE